MMSIVGLNLLALPVATVASPEVAETTDVSTYDRFIGAMERVEQNTLQPSRLAALEAGTLAIDGEAIFNAADRALRMGALIAIGTPFELLDYPMRVFSFPFSLFSSAELIPMSGRSSIRYLSGLRLAGYDFRNKKVLDVGSGNSWFASLLNFTHEATGTRAFSVDRKMFRRDRLGLCADVARLPYQNHSFDLVMNNYTWAHYLSTQWGPTMLAEMLRITKPGGEIRVSFFLPQAHLVEHWYVTHLKEHPAVEKVIRHSPLPTTPMTGTLEIHLRSTPPTQAEIIRYYEKLEQEGGIDIPWTADLLDVETVIPAVQKLKMNGTEEKITYVKNIRRLLLAGVDADPDYLKTMKEWVCDPQNDVRLKIAVMSFFMEQSEWLPHFKEGWETLTNGERNQAMRHWLQHLPYSGLMVGNPHTYFALSAEWEPDVAVARTPVQKQIDDHREIQEAYYQGKRERSRF